MKQRRMQKAFYRMMGLALTLVLVLGFTSYASRTTEGIQEEIDEQQEKIDQTQQEIQETTDKKKKLEEAKAGMEAYLSDLNKKYASLSEQIEDLNNQIAEKEKEIEQAQADLEEAKQVEEEQYEAMKKRIQFMYEKRDYVLLEMFFGSANFSDLLNRNDYIEQLSAYDRKQLTEYQETRASIEDKEARLESEKKDLDDLKTKVEAEQSRVAGLVSQTSGQISDYQHQISETEQEMLAYEKQLEEQNNNIAQLQKQLEEERRLSQLAAQSTWRDISEITFADGDRYLLANLIYCEAGNQPYSGQVAVGAVVINRVKSAVFPDTVVGVIYQNKQFSPVASGRLALALAENHATQACYKAADEAMAGATTVGDCLFFRTPIEGLTGIQIGGHIFY